MPRPVFPVVRLPYDQPDRVTRVLETVRREFVAAACRRQPPRASCRAAGTDDTSPRTVVADTSPGASVTATHARQPRAVEAARGPPTDMTKPTTAGAAAAAAADDQTVDQVTVGVRECTLTPKVRPDILVTAGGSNACLGGEQRHPDDDGFCNGGGGGSPYLLVPPVNITAEISRPPLTAPMQRYTATSS